MPGSPGEWCGIAPFGPLATIVSNAGASAPRSIMARSSSTARSRSVRPGTISPRIAGERLGGDSAGAGQQRDLRLVLDHPQALDDVPERDQCGTAGQRGEDSVPLDGHVLRLEGQRPVAARGREPGRAGSKSRSVAISMSGQSRSAASA